MIILQVNAQDGKISELDEFWEELKDDAGVHSMIRFIYLSQLSQACDLAVEAMDRE